MSTEADTNEANLRIINCHHNSKVLTAMGKIVRRIPRDFDWPLNRTWQGYLRPEHLQETPCPSCYVVGDNGEHLTGDGSTSASQWLYHALYLVGMVADDIRARSLANSDSRFNSFGNDVSELHPWLAALREIPVRNLRRRPSADIVNLVDGIAASAPSGSYASNFAVAAHKVLTDAAGLGERWGWCTTCNGAGSLEKYPGQRADAEAWLEENHDPPTGEGFQVWETVSEGSPVSPVFADREQLVDWLMSPAYNTLTTRALTRDQAERFVDSGSAPTAVCREGQSGPGEAMLCEEYSR